MYWCNFVYEWYVGYNLNIICWNFVDYAQFYSIYLVFFWAVVFVPSRDGYSYLTYIPNAINITVDKVQYTPFHFQFFTIPVKILLHIIRCHKHTFNYKNKNNSTRLSDYVKQHFKRYDKKRKWNGVYFNMSMVILIKLSQSNVNHLLITSKHLSS